MRRETRAGSPRRTRCRARARPPVARRRARRHAEQRDEGELRIEVGAAAGLDSRPISSGTSARSATRSPDETLAEAPALGEHLAHDQRRNPAAPPRKCSHDHAEEVGDLVEVFALGRHDLAHALQHAGEGALEQRVVEAVLVAEVVVDHGGRHAGSARQLAQGHLVHAPLGEEPARRVEQRLADVGPPSRSVGRPGPRRRGPRRSCLSRVTMDVN